MVKIPSAIGDYAVLPITIPATSSYAVSPIHHIYVRPHAPKVPTPSDSRSLFLVNVPIDGTEAHIRAIFSSLLGAGRFESCTFENERDTRPIIHGPNATALSQQNKKRKRGNNAESDEAPSTELPRVWDTELRRSGSTAVAVLADEKSVELALKAIKKAHKQGEFPVWGEGLKTPVSLGSARYLAHQKMRYPAKAVLQAAVDNFMADWNRREEEEAQASKRQRNVPDEDGFITVTRGGRVGPARQHDAEEARRKELEKEEAKRKSMGDFYRFQGRERRKEEQGELLKRFEEDRARVEAMKSERRGRFRPE
jgi:ribosomal RNA-processing protein 7